MVEMVQQQFSQRVTSITPQGGDVLEQIERFAGPFPQAKLVYEPKISTLWIELRPEPKPVFTLTLVESVSKIQNAIRRYNTVHPDEPILFLAYRGRGDVFSLGGDLDFYLDCLATNDRAGLAEYARLATDVIAMNTTGIDGRVISLATVHSRALGGGIDPARACNVMIAEQPATFSYPEVNYNHFPISAVPVLIRRAGAIEAERILTSGDVYTADEFLAKGVLDAVVPAGQGEDWIRQYVTKARTSHRARIMLFQAFNRRFGDLQQELSTAANDWVQHIMTLSPIEISKLQRIAHAQERMLARRPARELAAPLSH